MKSKLPREIQSLVNRKAHAVGVAYAEQQKAELLDTLEQLQTDGASLQEMRQYIEGNGGE